MSKVNKKFIDFGTTGNKVSATDLPANRTATNYTATDASVKGHLDGIDTKLGLAVGSAGDIGETSFSTTNNQSSPANVTSFAFANNVVRSFEALVSVSIDADTDLFEVFTLRGIQKTSDWSLTVSSSGDNSGIVFSITSAGQIQYTSSDVTGFSSGAIKFRAITTTV